MSARELRGQVYYPPEFRRLAQVGRPGAADPGARDPMAQGRTRAVEARGRTAIRPRAPAYLGSEEPHLEGRWSAWCARHPVAAERLLRVCCAVYGAVAMAVLYWWWTS